MQYYRQNRHKTNTGVNKSPPNLSEATTKQTLKNLNREMQLDCLRFNRVSR